MKDLSADGRGGGDFLLRKEFRPAACKCRPFAKRFWSSARKWDAADEVNDTGFAGAGSFVGRMTGTDASIDAAWQKIEFAGEADLAARCAMLRSSDDLLATCAEADGADGRPAAQNCDARSGQSGNSEH